MTQAPPLAGLMLGTGSIVHGIHDAPRAAHWHNARARARQLSITPVLIVGPGSSTGVGLQRGRQLRAIRSAAASAKADVHARSHPRPRLARRRDDRDACIADVAAETADADAAAGWDVRA